MKKIFLGLMMIFILAGTSYPQTSAISTYTFHGHCEYKYCEICEKKISEWREDTAIYGDNMIAFSRGYCGDAQRTLVVQMGLINKLNKCFT